MRQGCRSDEPEPSSYRGTLENPLAGGTALAGTALGNPFYGIVAGQVVVLLGGLGLLPQ